MGAATASKIVRMAGTLLTADPSPSVVRDPRPGAFDVGFTAQDVSRFCARPELSTRLANRWQVKNNEADAPVWSCRQLRGPWSALWPRMKVIG